MKIVCLALLVRLAVVDVGVEAFTGPARVLPRSAVGNVRPPSTTFIRHHLGDLEHDVLPEEPVGDNCKADAAVSVTRETATIFFSILFVGLALTQGFFRPRPAFAAEHDFSSFARDAPTVVLSGVSIKDSDIADFSMPSYQEASRAEVNSNLKGDKFLLGEASKSFMSESSSPSSTEEKEVKAAPAVDEKALKAARKAASQEAKARQLAAIEAAAKAASSN